MRNKLEKERRYSKWNVIEFKMAVWEGWTLREGFRQSEQNGIMEQSARAGNQDKKIPLLLYWNEKLFFLFVK